MRHSSRKKRRIYAAPEAALTAKQTPETGSPTHLDTHPVLHLQRLIGNRAVQGLFTDKSIQRQAAAPPTFSPPSEIIATDRPTLRSGSEGPDVIFLQRRLNLHGANLVEDGVFGPLTRQAVIEFQTAHAPPVDGIVGPITWTALHKDPVVAQEESEVEAGPLAGQGVDNTPLSEIGVGSFAPHVNANFIDDDIARLLNALQLRFEGSFVTGSFSTDTGEVARQELGNGNLIGIVKASNIEKLRDRVPANGQSDIDDINKNGIVVNGTQRKAVTRVIINKGVARSIIVVADEVMQNAELPGDGRDLAQDVIVHELNHHRNLDAGIADLRTPISSEEYVDVPLALKQQKLGVNTQGERSTTTRVRAVFIHELTARHAEFLVSQERLQIREESPEPLEHGEFFNAALDYAKNEPESYGDNGYLKTLAETDEAAFRKQVATWMRHLNEREFHSNPFEDFIKHNFFEREFQLAQSHNFDRFAQKSRGLRDSD